MRGRKIWIYAVPVLVFIAYEAWILGPYLRSVIARDAAVTTWSNVATSPIDGEVEFKPLPVDRMVGSDGIVLWVRNDRLSRQTLTQAEIRVERAQTRVAELAELLDEIVKLDEGRGALKAKYADTFRAQLDTEITDLQQKIRVATEQLMIMRQITERSEELQRRGTGSISRVDEERLRFAYLEQDITALKSRLNYAKVRRQAADDGIFITPDGEDPTWVRGWRLELKMAKKDTRRELREAEVELDLAIAALKSAAMEFENLRESVVTAPVGSVVWDERVAPGAAVRRGDPLFEWLDCSKLMIDVPVSDSEVALIRPGTGAEVVLEGKSTLYKSTVVMTRGSASPLTRSDLVAFAKGRGIGGAQVLVDFPREFAKFDECPVGRSAYVNFPNVGLIDILQVRLRL